MPYRIAIIGGGPSALFVFKRLLEAGRADLRVAIYERGDRLGVGMPYGLAGAGPEHITNVSGNELPDLVTPLAEWVRSRPAALLEEYQLDRHAFDEEKVLPRLLFGHYLQAQFEALLEQARDQGLMTEVRLGVCVDDLIPFPDGVAVEVAGERVRFDQVVICSGHRWPRDDDERIGYYACPYPPAKLARSFPHPVALRGSSLTAVDAIRTLARHNGCFQRLDGRLRFLPQEGFRLVMHTRSGLLPCVRFHLEDPQVTGVELLSQDQIAEIRRAHCGFVPLDLIFEEYFKKLLADKDPEMYARIRSLSLEELVEAALAPREKSDPFDFFRAEYREARASVALRESIAWKEALAVLSYAVNYPAKYFCAEDMLRLKKVLQPLIAIVIAYVPHSSSQEMLALHEAGCLDLVSVGPDSEVKVEGDAVVYHFQDEDGKEQALRYSTYVDCVGQPQLPLDAFPFPTLLERGCLRQARARFRSPEAARRQQADDPEHVWQESDGSWHLKLPGIAIDDNFRPLGSKRLFVMAVPYMGGHNPDYSGLDFCEEASARIVEGLLEDLESPG